VSIANNVSAAFGPVIGGVLVSIAGWQGIFWVNVPFTLIGLLMAWSWLPPDKTDTLRDATRRRLSVVLRELDVPGVVLFTVAIIGVLAFLLSIGGSPEWWLLGAAILAGVVLVWRERSLADPFLDVRFLMQNRTLVQVYLEFAAVSLIFYGSFFGLPLWLQQVRHFGPAMVGLVVLPISGVAVLLIPVAARMIARGGLRTTLLIGAVTLLLAVLLQLTFDADLPVIALVAIAAVIGVASAFNNLGLQAALYQFAPADRMGTATGQFQTFRYIGATLCTALLGLIFGATATTEGLHTLALTLAPIALLLIVANLRLDAKSP
jgi:predicted MFS family arabinose efflux permease